MGGRTSWFPRRARALVALVVFAVTVLALTVLALVLRRPSCVDLVEGDHLRAARPRCAEALASGREEAAPFLARALAGVAAEGLDAAEALEDLAPSVDRPEVWRALAEVEAKRGRREGAVEAGRRAASGFEAAGRLAEASAEHYRSFKLAYYADDQLGALAHLEESWRLAAASDDRDRKRSALFAYFNLLYRLGDMTGARFALDLLEPLLDANDPPRRMAWLNDRGVLALARGELRRARRAFARALEEAEAGGPTTRVYDVLQNLAETELELGALDRAGSVVERLLAFPDRGEDPRYPTKLFVAAKWAQARGEHEQAITLFRKALAGGPVFEHAWELETRLGASLEAIEKLEEADAAFESAVARIEARRSEVAVDRFQASNLRQARLAYERLFLLRLRRAGPRAALAVYERMKGRVFAEALRQGSSALVQPGDRSFVSSRTRADELAKLHALLRSSETQPPTPLETLWPIVQRAQVLAWLDAMGKLYLLAVVGGEPEVQSLGSSEEVARAVEALRADPGDPDAARALRARILPTSVAGRLDPTRGVALIPDRSLSAIPLGLLLVDGERLGARFPLTYVSSLAALARAPEARSELDPPVVLVGSPGLPAAVLEATEIAEHFRVPLRHPARRSDLAEAARARHLHVASHAGLGPVSPWLELEDGPIYPSDILRQRIGPRTVVLASCSSAARWGDDLWGSMAAAFLAAGADNVVGTMWSVEDQAAREFVRTFYAEGGAKDPLEATRAAKARLIEAGAPAEAWGPFVHLGAPEEKGRALARSGER